MKVFERDDGSTATKAQLDTLNRHLTEKGWREEPVYMLNNPKQELADWMKRAKETLDREDRRLDQEREELVRTQTRLQEKLGYEQAAACVSGGADPGGSFSEGAFSSWRGGDDEVVDDAYAEECMKKYCEHLPAEEEQGPKNKWRLQSRWSPDQWLHGNLTGAKTSGHTIALPHYRPACDGAERPKKHLKLAEAFQRTAVAEHGGSRP